jgi:hypothetical protein
MRFVRIKCGDRHFVKERFINADLVVRIEAGSMKGSVIHMAAGPELTCDESPETVMSILRGSWFVRLERSSRAALARSLQR